MRIAYIAVEIPERSSVSPVLLDTEEILDLSRHHTLEIFTDSESDGVARLRESGVSVTVAPKRYIQEGAVLRSSDTMVAGQLADAHSVQPYDEIWIDAGYPTDPGFFEPAVADVPAVAVLPGTLASALPLVWSLPHGIASSGIVSWAQTGRLASADRIVTNADPSEYGLLTAGLPPTERLHQRPDERTAPARADLAVVVATALDARGYAGLLSQAVKRIDAATIAVVHLDLMIGGTSVADLIRIDPPDDTIEATIMVSSGTDGTAAAFLSAADVIICATAADLAVPAVRDACTTRPWLILDESKTESGTSTVDSTPHDGLDFDIVEVAPGAWGEKIGAQAGAAGSDSMTVFYSPGHYLEALELARYPRLASTDLAVVAEPDGIFGEATCEISIGVVAVHGTVARSVQRTVGDRADLEGAIAGLFDAALVASASIAIYPVIAVEGRGVSWTAPSTIDTWVGGRPTLSYSAINLGGSSPPRDIQPELPIGIQEWAANQAWTERARLALPWKWNLLERGMRDRW